MEISTQSRWLALLVAAAMGGALVGCERQDAASGDNAKSSSSGTMMDRGTAMAPGDRARLAGSKEGGYASPSQSAAPTAPPAPAAGDKTAPTEAPSTGKAPATDDTAAKPKGAS